MSDAHPPFHLPILGDTLSVVYNTPRMQEWITKRQDTFENRHYVIKFIGAPSQVIAGAF